MKFSAFSVVSALLVGGSQSKLWPLKSNTARGLPTLKSR